MKYILKILFVGDVGENIRLDIGSYIVNLFGYRFGCILFSLVKNDRILIRL